MARIPEYQPQIQTSPLANKRATAFVSPLAAGGGFTEAIQRMASGVADVAEAMDYKDQITAKADSDNAYNQYMEHRRQVLYDPETGYLNQQGANALGDNRGAALDELSKRRAAVEAGLSPRALQDFARRADGVDNNVKDTTIQHNSSELRSYSSAQTEAAVKASLDAAGLAYNDEETSSAYLEEALHGIEEKAMLEGWPPAQLESARNSAISQTTAQRAINMAYDDPVIADQFLDANADRMDRNTYLELKDGLKGAVRQKKADTVVGPMFTPGGSANAMPRSPAAVAQGRTLLETGAQLVGMDENAQNDAIRQYLSDGGVNLDPAKVAWCAAFVNGTLGQTGVGGTSSNMARSFLDWGQDASTDPQPGDVIVLERGKPPFGHVGFIAGINEDGSYRVLGGNQGDSVSIATYSGDKVLGIRRATGGAATGGQGVATTDTDLSNSLDVIMSEPDIDLRNEMLDNFSQRLKVRDQQEALQRKSLMDDAVEDIFSNGANPDNLSPEAKIKIGAGGMESLRAAYRQDITGVDVNNPQTFQHIYDLSLSADAETQREFAEMNLNDYAGELSQSSLTQLKAAQAEVQQQLEVRNSGRASEVVYERADFGRISDSARGQFEVIMGDKETDATRLAWQQFQTQLKSRLVQYANTEGVQMPDALVDANIGALLMRTNIINPGMIYNTTEAETIFAAVPSRPGGTEVEIAMQEEDVPFAERERITRTLMDRWERPPTQEEVVDQYELEALHRAGFRVDIEYEDIPADLVKRIRQDNPRFTEDEIIGEYLDMMAGE